MEVAQSVYKEKVETFNCCYKMKISHHEIDLSPENPFSNCKLEREPYAKFLTDIVSTYADGFVLGINNEWGTGKTVKRICLV